MSRQLRYLHAEVFDDANSAHLHSGAVGSGKTCRSVHAPILKRSLFSPLSANMRPCEQLPSMKSRHQAGDDAYAGSYMYARAHSPGRQQFAQQHAPPEYSPSGLHEGAEKDAWAPDKKTRFESMSSVSFRDDPKKRGTVSQGSPHERWRDREQLSGDLRPGLTHLYGGLKMTQRLVHYSQSCAGTMRK